MKRHLSISIALILALSILGSFSVASAELQLDVPPPPPQQNPPPPKNPAPPPSPITKELKPKLPIDTQQKEPGGTGDSGGVTKPGDPNVITVGSNTNNGTLSTGGSRTNPTAEVTTLEVGTENIDPNLDSSGNFCPQISEQTQCITPENANSLLGPKFSANQLRTMAILLFGSLIGSFFWMFSMRFAGQNQLRRTQSKSTRRLKSALEDKKRSSLIKTYRHLADAIANLDNASGKHKYSAVSSEIELNGSKSTRQANQDFMALVTKSKVKPEEIVLARRNLIKAFKADLGL